MSTDANMQDIPKWLVYEMDYGRPIYYKGYKEYLNGKNQDSDVMGSSYLQSDIITTLLRILLMNVSDTYKVLTNEVGLQLAKNAWRASDIVIINKEKAKAQKHVDKYLAIPPDIVIEIDIKADLSEVENETSYFHKKTDQLLEFGVQKVIWIFTDAEKVVVAEPQRPWQTFDWECDFEVIDNIEVNIKSLIDKQDI